MAVCRMRMRITMRRMRTRMSARVLQTTKDFLIGLRHRERVPNVEPRGTSHSKSGIKAGKLKNKWMGRVW